MKNWKTLLILLFAVAVMSVASHRTLSNRPVDLLFLRAGDKVVEAHHLALYLNGQEPTIDTLRLDSAQRKRIVRIVSRKNLQGLEEFTHEQGEYRFVSVVRSSPDGWPWYLGGEAFIDDALSNMTLLDKWYLRMMTGTPPPPRYEAGENNAGDDATEADAGGREVELHPEDWVQSHPLNRPTENAGTLAGTAAVKVEILNDCGITGIADGVASALKRPGIEIVHVGNAPRFKRRTTRIQSSVGIPVALQEMLEVMGIPPEAVEEVPAGRRRADVTVIVGRDYKKIMERMRDRTRE